LRLIHRTTRRFDLTEAGTLYYARCRRIIEEALLAHEQLSDMLRKPTCSEEMAGRECLGMNTQQEAPARGASWGWGV